MGSCRPYRVGGESRVRVVVTTRSREWTGLILYRHIALCTCMHACRGYLFRLMSGVSFFVFVVAHSSLIESSSWKSRDFTDVCFSQPTSDVGFIDCLQGNIPPWLIGRITSPPSSPRRVWYQSYLAEGGGDNWVTRVHTLISDKGGHSSPLPSTPPTRLNHQPTPCLHLSGEAQEIPRDARRRRRALEDAVRASRAVGRAHLRLAGAGAGAGARLGLDGGGAGIPPGRGERSGNTSGSR